jgi:CRISPR-associated protein Cas5t
MNEFYLRVRAPFAAYRLFQAGVYRPSSPVITHSAALGLILNLAGIEMRDVRSIYNETTVVRADVPTIRLAVGVVNEAGRSSLYQQLHTYPIGANERAKVLEGFTKNAKHWIVIARREVLVGLDCILGVQESGDLGLLELIKKGLSGHTLERYGLPFAGDNNFLFDTIQVFDQPPVAARWYTPIKADESPRRGSCQLTIGIHRTDNSRTESKLFAPTLKASEQPPSVAWTWTPREPSALST